MQAIVQISLDVITIPEALDTAHLAIRAGVDWLEAGTPLIIAEGMNGVRALRQEFARVPIVADLKTMDGGWLEVEIMAKAGATHVVVMERAHPETIKMVVKAGRDFGVKVMGDNLGADDKVAAAKRLEDLGCDFVIHHIGYDERRGFVAAGGSCLSPLDQLREVVRAVGRPVQAVGGLSIEQAMRTPEYGAPLVVLGAPLTIDANAFRTAEGDLESKLRLICEKIHGYGDIAVGR
jgi:3-hexulose-6-phosphate synthase/6-phospho-3-hexuloisomerase